MVPVMCALDPPSPETRGQRALAALPPSHGPKPLRVSKGQFFDRDRLPVTEAHTFSRTASALSCRDRSAGRLWPDRQGFADAYGVGQLACFQSFAEGGHLAISGIGQHHRRFFEPPVQRLV